MIRMQGIIMKRKNSSAQLQNFNHSRYYPYRKPENSVDRASVNIDPDIPELPRERFRGTAGPADDQGAYAVQG